MNQDISYYQVILTLITTLIIAGICLYCLSFFSKFCKKKLQNLNDFQGVNDLKFQQKYIDNKRKILIINYQNIQYIILLQDGVSPLIVNQKTLS